MSKWIKAKDLLINLDKVLSIQVVDKEIRFNQLAGNSVKWSFDDKNTLDKIFSRIEKLLEIGEPWYPETDA